MSTEEIVEADINEGCRTRLDILVNKSGHLFAWLIFFAMAISVYEVFMRYLFKSPTSWVHESVVFLVAAAFSIGGPVALAQNKHIRVRVVYDFIRPSLRRWLDVFNDAVIFVFCLAMSYASYVMFWRSSHDPSGAWSFERSGTSWNPAFPSYIKGIIMLSVMVMTVQALLHVIQSLRGKHPELLGGLNDGH